MILTEQIDAFRAAVLSDPHLGGSWPVVEAEKELDVLQAIPSLRPLALRQWLHEVLRLEHWWTTSQARRALQLIEIHLPLYAPPGTTTH